MQQQTQKSFFAWRQSDAGYRKSMSRSS